MDYLFGYDTAWLKRYRNLYHPIRQSCNRSVSAAGKYPAIQTI